MLAASSFTEKEMFNLVLHDPGTIAIIISHGSIFSKY